MTVGLFLAVDSIRRTGASADCRDRAQLLHLDLLWWMVDAGQPLKQRSERYGWPSVDHSRALPVTPSMDARPFEASHRGALQRRHDQPWPGRNPGVFLSSGSWAPTEPVRFPSRQRGAEIAGDGAESPGSGPGGASMAAIIRWRQRALAHAEG